ncbi:SMI1/KNR4 family protein [Streptomyces sp. NBC_01264]|uniref:SMI1/KNR4 family protein n=1 Tax=Streptomyces sp. NBC_01264 TaxID=2903804 RepID=UPI00225B9B7E|nr:SMI1/KNR4 family protein [Streptomyces sp. NBC_01264]MCX4775991.1 SMI1/KNR4 family protein [Streptomyces sp. NBC_01264]
MISGDTLLKQLRALAARVPFDLAVQPGVADADFDHWPVPVPAEARELLGRLGGFAVPPVEFRLTGHPRQAGDHGLPHPHWLVTDDGGGGVTWVDIEPDGRWGQVLMQYREGGLHVEADSLPQWLDRLLGTAEELVEETGFEEGVQPYADDFWDLLHLNGPELPLHPAAELLDSTDPVVARLAAEVPDGALVADLRGALPGSRARFDRALRRYRLTRAVGGPVFAAVPRAD